MSTVAVSEHLQELRALVTKLELEHKQFASDIETMQANLEEVESIRRSFVPLQDSLTEHMLEEEFEVYPELMRKNLFDLSTSAIMQQHHDVTASLGKMELSLRLVNMEEFKAALDQLTAVLRSHQPAEETKVFPLAIR